MERFCSGIFDTEIQRCRELNERQLARARERARERESERARENFATG